MQLLKITFFKTKLKSKNSSPSVFVNITQLGYELQKRPDVDRYLRGWINDIWRRYC